MNEVQVAPSNLELTTVEGDLFATSSGMGHCVSSDVFKGVGLAKQLDRLQPQVKHGASKNRNVGSVFSFYDQYSRSWLYN